MPTILSQIQNGSTVNHETSRRHKNGNAIAISLTDSPIRDDSGRIVGVSKIARDIRAQRAAMVVEAAERKSAEDRFRLVVEAAPNAMIMAAADGRIVLVNSQTERLFGYTRDELLGQPLEMLVPERYRAGHTGLRTGFFAEPSTRVMGGGRDLFGVRKNGAEVPIEIGLNPLTSSDGNFVLAAVIDITERKRAQDELAAAKLELEIRNKDLETILHVTSHDLREPLRGIRNFSMMLSDQYAGKLDEKGRTLVSRIKRAAERLDQLVQDVLSVSQTRRISPPDELLPGRLIVADALRVLSARIAETHAHIDVAEDFPDLRVSLVWGSLAIQNLVGNALKFTSENATPEIEIGGFCSETGNEAGIVVRDRGIGVAPRHAERIFELFQRAVGREIEGTGAGLAIVRQIAERHGGHARMRMREGGGSEFMVTFGSGHATAAEAK
jgi:PAS domain S-box-containing protein